MRIAVLGAATLTLVFASNTCAALVPQPLSLSPGDQYRLIFTTSKRRDASDSDVAAYDRFVQGLADQVPGLVRLGSTWQAIVSTESVDASVHTNTGPGSSDSIPIFRVDGVVYRESEVNLWPGDVSIGPSLRVKENGQAFTEAEYSKDFFGHDIPVWTGTDSVFGVGYGDSVMGMTRVSYGNAVLPTSENFNFGVNKSNRLAHLYGISNPITAILLGDYLMDGVLTSEDLDSLCSFTGSGDSPFDFNHDQVVDSLDVAAWLDYANFAPGDADLDGQVNFVDFLTLGQSFQTDASWSQGDFDCNGKVEFSDFLILSEHFGVTSVASQSVPVPSSACLAAAIGIAALIRRRSPRIFANGL